MATTKRAPLRRVGELQSFGQSTDDQRRRAELLAAQRVVLIHDLHGEFARGHQHERRDTGRFLLQQAFDHGDQERERLAGPGLRGGQHVFACQ